MPIHEYADLPDATSVPRGSILALKPEQITEQTLARYSANDVASLAIVIGAPHSGNRSETIRRIITAWELRTFLADATAEALRKLPGKQLKAKLRSVGAYAPSTKYGMAAALIGWRDKCRLEGKLAIAKAHHYTIIRRAVRRGLPVPLHVLENYPDLQAANNPMPLFDRDDDDASP